MKNQKPREFKNIIYGLRDSRNDVYFYIGKSTVGVGRPLTHLFKSHSEEVNKRIAELRDKGKAVIIDIIEKVSDIDELSEREKYWISYYYNVNPDLLNYQLIPKGFYSLRDDDTDDEYDFLVKVIEDLPQIIKRERMFRGLTQEKMASLSGLSRSTISLLEKGRSISLSSIKLCIEVLNTKDRVCSVKTDRSRKIRQNIMCDHPFKRIHWVGSVVFCNKCRKNIHHP